MSRGGARPGAGRPKGAVSKLAHEAIARAKTSGELPHEFLLRVARGEKVGGKLPALALRLDAAKAAAPYFAPKLSYTEAVIDEQNDLASMTDDELAAREREIDAVLAMAKKASARKGKKAGASVR